MLVLHNKLGGVAKGDECIKDLIQWFKLSDELLAKVTKKGESLFSNSVWFVRLSLIQAGYLKTVSRGVWGLSQKGKDKIPDLIDLGEKQLNAFRGEVKEKVKKKQKESLIMSEEDTVEMPEEEIDEERKKEEQLAKISSMDPFAFEKLCGKLFESMGYRDVKVTKRSKDGGIDGLGFLTFGLVRFKVVFQAKRWSRDTKINPDLVKGLLGAKELAKAEKAVLITTSNFTAPAEEVAVELGIECINGDELIELLQKHELGYSVKSVIKEYEFNSAFFDNL